MFFFAWIGFAYVCLCKARGDVQLMDEIDQHMDKSRDSGLNTNIVRDLVNE